MRYISRTPAQRQNGRRWLTAAGVIASTAVPLRATVETGFETPADTDDTAPISHQALAATDERGKRMQQNIEKLVEMLAKKEVDKKKLAENNFASEGERVETERRILWSDATAHELRVQMELKQLKQANRLPLEQVEEAWKQPATLVVPIRDASTQESYYQAIRFNETDFENLKEFVMNISEDHLKQKFAPQHAQYLIELKTTQPKKYMTAVLVELCNKIDSVNQWVMRQADEHHPLYLPDGKFDRSKLPSDLWDVVELKGVGEVPYLKADRGYLPTAMDYWFFNKLFASSMVDRRFLNSEFDPTSNPSSFGRVLTLIQSAVERHYKMVRPADKDKDYYFPLAEEVPFTGASTTLDDATMEKTGQFLVGETLGKILGNAPADNKPSRVVLRQAAIDILSDIKNLKSFAQGAFTKKDTDDKKTPPVQKSSSA